MWEVLRHHPEALIGTQALPTATQPQDPYQLGDHGPACFFGPTALPLRLGGRM